MESSFVNMTLNAQPSSDEVERVPETLLTSPEMEKSRKGFPKTGASGDNLPLSYGQEEEEDWKEKEWKEDVPVEISGWISEDEGPVIETRVLNFSDFLTPEPKIEEAKLDPKPALPVQRRKLRDVLQMPTIIPMTCDFTSTGTKYVGEFEIENTSDDYYGYKIMSNRSARGSYEASPSVECIPPSQRITVRLESVDGISLSQYLAASDTIIVRGHRLGGPVDGATLRKFMNKMTAVWPRNGEKVELKPFLLEPGSKEVLDAVEFEVISGNRRKLEKNYEMMHEYQLANERHGSSIHNTFQRLGSSELQISRTRKTIQSVNFGNLILTFGVDLAVICCLILPFYYTDVPKLKSGVISSDLNAEGYLSTLWSIVRDTGLFLYSIVT